MTPARMIAAVAGTALMLPAIACGGHSGGGGGGGGGITSPSTVGMSGAPPTYVDEAGRNIAGVHPAPLIVGGTTYLYLNTAGAGVTVASSSDGLTFANVPAKYPAGISRTIVPTTDGRFRMYYFADANAIDVSSAVSTDGVNWTTEAGVRYTDPNSGGIRATALQGGGYRIYAPEGSGLVSFFSFDGLTFTAEGPLGITANDSTYTWGVSTAAYINGQYHMILTRIPSSTSITELWHAISADGRAWTLDRSVLAANPGVSINQPAWCINGSTNRVYYRSQFTGSNGIASGVIRF